MPNAANSSRENPAPAAEDRPPILASWRVGADGDGVRLDVYVAGHTEAFPSRKAAWKAAKQDRLLVNDVPAPPHRRLQIHDRIALRAAPRPPPPLALPIEVVFEDEWLAVVVKPAGIPTSGNYARTLVRALPANLAPSALPDALPAPHPVHRLDSPTGGLLLVAKSAAAACAVGRQFEQKAVAKRYRAIATGRLVPTAGSIVRALDGKEAHTDYRVVSHTRSLSVDWLTLVDLFPKTGRTHQLRRHLAALGHPIIGDRQYAAGRKVLRGKGLFLWAAEIAFRHPGSERTVCFSREEPPKFAAYLEREARRHSQAV